MAYETVPGAKGPAPQLAYSNLAPSHTALRANKTIYSVNPACPGEFKHGDSFVKWGYLGTWEKKTSRS